MAEPGCLRALAGIVLGFGALEGGLVLAAVGLHLLLGPRGYTPLAAGLALGGVLLVFAGPRIVMLAFRARPSVTWAQAAAAAPDFALAFWFVLGWAAPQVIGVQAAKMLVGIMVLEFIVIHASAMLVALPQNVAHAHSRGRWWETRPAILGGLLLLYGVFAAGISAAFKTWWLFLGFVALLASKFVGDWIRPPANPEEHKQQHLARWGSSAFVYLVLAFGSIFLPVPRLGAVSGSSGDGLWETNPEQAVALGAMYFATLAFLELYGGFKKSNLVQAKES